MQRLAPPLRQSSKDENSSGNSSDHSQDGDPVSLPPPVPRLERRSNIIREITDMKASSESRGKQAQKMLLPVDRGVSKSASVPSGKSHISIDDLEKIVGIIDSMRKRRKPKRIVESESESSEEEVRQKPIRMHVDPMVQRPPAPPAPPSYPPMPTPFRRPTNKYHYAFH